MRHQVKRALDERYHHGEDERWAAERGDEVICWTQGRPLYRSRLGRYNQLLSLRLEMQREQV